jgi:hypothetical protein
MLLHVPAFLAGTVHPVTAVILVGMHNCCYIFENNALTFIQRKMQLSQYMIVLQSVS